MEAKEKLDLAELALDENPDKMQACQPTELHRAEAMVQHEQHFGPQG